MEMVFDEEAEPRESGSRSAVGGANVPNAYMAKTQSMSQVRCLVRREANKGAEDVLCPAAGGVSPVHEAMAMGNRSGQGRHPRVIWARGELFGYNPWDKKASELPPDLLTAHLTDEESIG